MIWGFFGGLGGLKGGRRRKGARGEFKYLMVGISTQGIILRKKVTKGAGCYRV